MFQKAREKAMALVDNYTTTASKTKKENMGKDSKY